MPNKPDIKLKIPCFYYIAAFVGITCYFSKIPVGKAQISGDRTLPTSTEVSSGTLKGFDFLITGGTKVGNNLFHSFKEFSVPKDGSVIFKNDSNLANIINRVTGDLESNINGLIQTQGSANFFLINPNGIIFGSNASLDIGGSFFGSTATSLKLSNGDEFSAINPQKPLLTISVPLGLQFGNKTEAIVNQSQTGLQGLTNTTLALVGGEIQANNSNINVPDGRIELGSVEKNSFVSLIPNSQGFALGYAHNQKFQDIHLDKSSLDGGNIQLQGKTVTLNQSRLFTQTSSGIKNDGGINIKGDRLNINDSSVRAITFGAETGGDVTLEAEKINAQGQHTIVSTETQGAGNSGKLTVRASDVQLNDLSLLATESRGNGNAGDVLIEAQNLTIRDGAQLGIKVLAQGSGGQLLVNASDSIDVVGEKVKLLGVKRSSTEGNRFASGLFTQTQGLGSAAKLNINTDKLLIADGARVWAATSGGLGGDINLTANSLEVSNGGQLRSKTASNSNAGNITMILRDRILLTDTDSAIFTSTTADSEGNGGKIDIDSSSFIVRDKATIAVDSQGTGSGGDIKLVADSVRLNQGNISAQTLSNTGGNITLQLQDTLLLRRNSQIETVGGNISINSPFIITFPIENSDITANAFTEEKGNIQINTQSMIGIIKRDRLTKFSDITVSSRFSINDFAKIYSTEFDASEILLLLPRKATDASKLITQSCKARSNSGSTFFITGRSGLPPSPDSILSNSQILPDLATTPILNNNNLHRAAASPQTISHSASAIVEAQGIVVNDKGEIFLAAQVANLTSHTWLTARNCHG